MRPSLEQSSISSLILVTQLPSRPLQWPQNLLARFCTISGTPCLALRPDRPVGGRLADFADRWRQITTDQWVLCTLESGLFIELETPVPFQGIVYTRPSPQAMLIMQEEVDGLKQKRVIIPIPPRQAREGFYSTYFTVPKKDGGLRPILNLKRFNVGVKKSTFKMETLRSIISVTHRGQWLASLDLKDAYLHVPVHQPHRKYLRFVWKGQGYEFQALPFGLSTAPRAFTKILAPLIAHLRMQGVILYAYLDDILLVALSHRELSRSVLVAAEFLSDMGFIINMTKSEPNPTQDLVYIGARFRTDLGLVFLPDTRLQALVACARTFLLVGQYRTAHQYLRLIGLMAACLEVVRYARLAMRPIQWFVKDHWSSPLGLNHRVMITRNLASHVQWWTLKTNLAQGVELQPDSPSLVITTDASLEGWGGYLHGPGKDPILVQGEWSPLEKGLHINVLELRAVHLTFQRLEHKLRGKSILIECDNTTTVAYVNHQGGVHSVQLQAEAWTFYQWLMPRSITVKAIHRAGVDNTLADFLSRNRANSREWSLCEKVVKRIFSLWGCPMIDLFANEANHKLQLYFSLLPDSRAAGVDALSQDWRGFLLYAFPPTPLLLKIVNKIRVEQADVILIAPKWPRRPWYQYLLHMSCEIPRLLPQKLSLLSQVLEDKGTLYHSDPSSLRLVAWRLSGDVSKPKAFQRKLSSSQRQRYGNPPGPSTTLDGSLGSIGAVQGTQIPLLPL